MRLKLIQTKATRRVSPQDVRDYQTFSERFRRDADNNQLQIFERYHAATSLLDDGLTTFLNPMISQTDKATGATVDACGVGKGSLTIFLCQTTTPDSSLLSTLKMVDRSDNARAVIVAPIALMLKDLEESLPRAFESGKVAVEHLGWFDDHLDKTLQQTLKLIDLLGNETRMRMLTPLFRKASAKREYRASINPKLVYENLPVLIDAGLVDERDGTYDLSEFGRNTVAEFISFLERTRKALSSNSKTREVKFD